MAWELNIALPQRYIDPRKEGGLRWNAEGLPELSKSVVGEVISSRIITALTRM